MRTIMGIQVGDREHDALRVQELLTKHGCLIKTRLGLHETALEGQCSSKGLILLEFISGKEEEIKVFEQELAQLDSITVRQMIF